MREVRIFRRPQPLETAPAPEDYPRKTMMPDSRVLADSLIEGGDTRLMLGSDGLSKYGVAPYPRNTIPFGSCTASTPSLRAWEAAQAGAARIEELARHEPPAQVADALCAEIRQDLAALLGLEQVPGAAVVLTPSGTDAEMIALFLAALGTERGLVNVVVGPNEVGSGTTLAAAARHFDAVVPSGQRREVGQPVDEALAARVAVETVRLRTPSGTMRLPDDVDAEVRHLVERAVEAGKQVVVHIVAHSKTGVHAPTLDTVNGLVAAHGDRVVGLIDAAQGRISRRGLRDSLRRGYLILLTGSKFYGGPPFSGALLVPPRLSEGMAPAAFPEGFGDYFTAAEMPAAWRAARRSLPERANWGLVLRWLAALEEMRAYYRTDPAARLAVLRHFEQSAPRLLGAADALHLMPVWPPLLSDRAERVLESKTTVFSMKVQPPSAREPLPKPALAQWVGLLNKDLSAALGLTPASPYFEAARQPFQIGQPVALGAAGEAGHAIVRVALGASLITSLAEDPAYGATLGERLGWLDRQLARLAGKMTLLAERWPDLSSEPAL